MIIVIVEILNAAASSHPYNPPDACVLGRRSEPAAQLIQFLLDQQLCCVPTLSHLQHSDSYAWVRRENEKLR